MTHRLFRQIRPYTWLVLPLFLIVLTGCEPSAETNESTAARELSTSERGANERAIESADVVPMVPIDPSSSSEGERSVEPPPPASLSIGAPAPPLNIAEWSVGEPIGNFESDQVYVIEFWATWCGPCRTSMPHISQLQEEYGDTVRFVGVTREEPSVVESFLTSEQSKGRTWGEAIKYRLAIDEAGQTNSAYMRAAGQNGIPTAFIVGKDGIVEWIGHPMQMDAAIEKVVNGDWDRNAAISDFKAKQLLSESRRQLSTLQRAGKWDEALALLDELEQQIGENPALLDFRVKLLQSAGRTDELDAARTKLVELAWENPVMLNQVAWEMAIAAGTSEGDLALALKAAKRAAELSNHKDSAILDTLARVYYEQGDLESAIQWQQRAAEEAGNRREIIETLDKYLSERESK